MIYKLKGEFGEPFFEGSLSDVNMIKKAMVDYGILERKLHVVYNELHEFTLPDSIRDKMSEAVTSHFAEGRDYNSYAYDEAESEVMNMHDHELYQAYDEYICGYSEEEDQEDESLAIARDLEATYKLEHALAKG